MTLARQDRKRFARAALVGIGLLLLLAAAGAAWVVSLGPLPMQALTERSAVVTDRNGRLLRAFAMEDGRWRLPVHAGDVDPTYLAVLMAFEDKRFYGHYGVDPLALGRAAWQLATHQRIVSGGSTLTMQVARLIEPRSERSFAAKFRQIVRALQLEWQFSKAEILDFYLALAPFGGNLEGVRAATLAYFGKEPRRLSLSEAALLVALPQSPETRRLDRFADRARIARDRIIRQVLARGVVSEADARAAFAEAVPRKRLKMPLLAPHATDQTMAGKEEKTSAQLTLDANLQASLEALARDRAAALGPDISIGILAVDHASGQVLARVGSPDYFDERRAGQVDMTRAVRSPGSTLKPFIYGLAIEDGFVHPETLIDDRPVRYGSYAPENFDMSFQGTVSVRRALQYSLNVPAVALLDRVGAARLSARIRQAGATLVLPRDETPGLAMGLGGVGVTLTDLVQLYAGLARQGNTVALSDRAEEAQEASEPMRLLEPIAAWQIGNILIGTPPPDNAIGNRIAFKTGTSYGYRDAWSVGFDGRLTVGVWVGRPDGAPVPGLLGRSAAAPILFDAFARSGRTIAPLPAAPRGTLMAQNARLPAPLRHFRPSGELLRTGSAGAGYRRPLQIQFPPNGSQLDLGAERDAAGVERPGPMAIKVGGGVPPMRILVNGLAAGQIGARRQALVAAPGPGFARVTVLDAAGALDTVVVRLQ